MTEPTNDGWQDRIDHLRVQNRRYRELIQNLSSVVSIIRRRLEALQPSDNRLRVFETFDGERENPTLSQTRFSAAKNVLRRLFTRSRKPDPDDLKPLAPKPGWKCLAVDQPRLRIGFTIFGMTVEEVERVVDEVERRQVRMRDFTPVFVTDCPDLGPFRVRGYVAEYVPASITTGARRRSDERHYLDSRIEFITSKWGLGKIVDLS